LWTIVRAERAGSPLAAKVIESALRAGDREQTERDCTSPSNVVEDIRFAFDSESRSNSGVENPVLVTDFTTAPSGFGLPGVLAPLGVFIAPK
jgi:hypothetical protein